jgi:hypothetical protein
VVEEARKGVPGQGAEFEDFALFQHRPEFTLIFSNYVKKWQVKGCS